MDFTLLELAQKTAELAQRVTYDVDVVLKLTNYSILKKQRALYDRFKKIKKEE